MTGFIGGAVALLVGGGLATATIVGIVSNQTSKAQDPLPDGQSLQSQVMDYGSTQ